MSGRAFVRTPQGRMHGMRMGMHMQCVLRSTIPRLWAWNPCECITHPAYASAKLYVRLCASKNALRALLR